MTIHTYTYNYIKRYVVAIALLVAPSLSAMVFDNRFLPLYFKPYIYAAAEQSHFRVQPLFMRGEKAVGDPDDMMNNKINIADVYGGYNLVAIDRALQLSGRTDRSLLRPDLALEQNILFKRPSRFDVQGMAFYYQQQLLPFLSLGTSFLFLHLNSRYEFCLPKKGFQYPIGDTQYIFDTKACMHKLLGVTPALYSQTAFGDLDVYMRFFMGWDYTCKCKKIAGAVKLGMIAPTATDCFSQEKRAVNNPAAIPIGGQGHWGMYLALEGDFELKEDIFANVYLRAIKRFKKTSILRMPTEVGEPINYGAIVGPFMCDPGWTFVINPVVTFHGLQDGLGARLMYTGVVHLADTFTDNRCSQDVEQINMPRVNLARVRELSKWGMEHVTVGLFYDFSYYWNCPRYRPILSVYWDIPITGLLAKYSAKTNVVSLAFEMSF